MANNNQQPQSRLNNFEAEERAVEAQVILSSPVLHEALDGVYSRAVGTLLSSDVGSLTASTAHATMKAIQEIRAQLESFITEAKMRKKFKQGDK